MADTEKFEITLTAEQAAMVKERVANGDYASPDALIADALHDFGFAEDPAGLPPIEIMRQLVQESMDDPRPAVPLKDAFARIRDHMARSRDAGKAKRAS